MGGLGGSEHRSHSKSRHDSHTNGLMHKQVSCSGVSLQTRMHLHTEHKSTPVESHFTHLLCAHKECARAHLHTCIGRDLHEQILARLGRFACVPGQLGVVIIVRELCLIVTLFGGFAGTG